MKPSLQLNLTHQLTLTPQLQQAIRLLQLSTLDLRQEIQQRLETNPLLEANPVEEKEETFATQEKIEEFNDFQWSHLYSPSNVGGFNENDYIFETLHCTTANLREHLLWQLTLTPASETDKQIGQALIDAINDNGFLTLEIEELFLSLKRQLPTLDKEEILAVQHLIQNFDPIGCGCSTLVETLLVQLNQLNQNTPYISLIEDIIKNNIELLAAHNYKPLLKAYGISTEALAQIKTTIRQLNPKPGNAIASQAIEYAIPDLTVKKINGDWTVFLNNSVLPQLSINDYYVSLMNKAENNSDLQFLKNNLQEARWFLRSIKSRQETLLKVASYIVAYQKEFFDKGAVAMRPLILNEVASALSMHESTISRVTTQKFIHTPRGLFELKYFFSSHVSNQRGEECSSIAIQALIKKLIEAENPNAPLSDHKIMQKIAVQGIQIARRTVTKYREAMGIASSSERKRFRR
ncbi:RNA polymerase sigma-54 factor (sigma-L) (plasmid) [Legionella adelaidensis]|uniref:RNA polymerase sigma-54 factor n=1 Tax=Legionella adelaidensis TaxID=45056 RepID=A0A0W0R2S0_9GAMM|nr:RNA polymerase factor sigma-54 [Legionella adelaidensis]KTC65382.1 RNA polymerase sigma-54 factor (sigma-L) [Legionella adelaidensis]VEH84796.1 RNA polymerase sigma-54 factor (sigma-L) [Legionella adelaidensis]